MKFKKRDLHNFVDDTIIPLCEFQTQMTFKKVSVNDTQKAALSLGILNQAFLEMASCYDILVFSAS